VPGEEGSELIVEAGASGVEGDLGARMKGEERSLRFGRGDKRSKRVGSSEGLARRGGGKDEERFHREKTRDGEAVLSSQAAKDEERFLSSQADTFAGANVKGKGVGLLRSK